MRQVKFFTRIKCSKEQIDMIKVTKALIDSTHQEKIVESNDTYTLKAGYMWPTDIRTRKNALVVYPMAPKELIEFIERLLNIELVGEYRKDLFHNNENNWGINGRAKRFR